MITYMTIIFSSNGSRPSEVLNALHNLGFETTTGAYDCVYRWDSKATVEDAIYLADKVHATLKGMGVLFKLETVSDEL
ncbi:MAG: hypothetical protein QHH00_06115 [Methanomassiliicoccales archaeon]|nr:hypothetical protein [Methanomassiliicoccales archaeon]MDH7508958.1 hypothetical protein [Methanomassiliicoccales archaeon]